MKIEDIKKLYIILALAIAPAILLAFEGKVFNVTGNQVTITGEGVAHLKAGQKFGVYNGDVKTGEIVVQQASHTQAKAKILSGTAAKDAAVKEIVVEKKSVVSGNFRDNGDGTVTDTKTKLVWQKCSMGQNNDKTCSGEAKKFSWEDAKAVCRNLELAGKNWQLPDKEELKSLIYCSDGTRAVDIKHFREGNPLACGWKGGEKYENNYERTAIRKAVFINASGAIYWSSSVYNANMFNAFGVFFDVGALSDEPKTDNYLVRCVSEP